MKTAMLKKQDSTVILTPARYLHMNEVMGKEGWSDAHCVACETPLYLSYSSADTARFLHSDIHTEPAWICPLGEKTLRFRGLQGNERNAALHVACIRRAQFLMPKRFLEAWRICRQLSGNRLSVEAFARMVTVADSFNLWRCMFLPPWSIPLLLMLMKNHMVGQDGQKFYYRFTASAPEGKNGDDFHRTLHAHWLNSGAQVGEEESLGPYLKTIPFTESFAVQMLDENVATADIPDEAVREMAYHRRALADMPPF